MNALPGVTPAMMLPSAETATSTGRTPLTWRFKTTVPEGSTIVRMLIMTDGAMSDGKAVSTGPGAFEDHARLGAEHDGRHQRG